MTRKQKLLNGLKLIFRKIILFEMVYDGKLSLAYWWNYDVSDKYILFVHEDVRKGILKLRFGKELMPIKDNVFRLYDTDGKSVNKEIINPKPGKTYSYNYDNDKFTEY